MTFKGFHVCDRCGHHYDGKSSRMLDVVTPNPDRRTVPLKYEMCMTCSDALKEWIACAPSTS